MGSGCCRTAYQSARGSRAHSARVTPPPLTLTSVSVSPAQVVVPDCCVKAGSGKAPRPPCPARSCPVALPCAVAKLVRAWPQAL